MNKLLERLELPPELNTYCERACDYIVGLILFTVNKNLIKSNKTKSADEIVTTHKLYRKGKQLFSSGKQYFSLKKINLDSGSHLYDTGLVPKNKEMPSIGIIIETVDIEKKEIRGFYSQISNSIFMEIYFSLDEIETDNSLNKLILDIKDTLKHEMRHYYQVNNRSNFGVSKAHILRNKIYKDYLGMDKRNVINYKKLIHPLTPLEFKTNVYTYANDIKKYLNSNFSRNDWKIGFIELLNSENTIGYLNHYMHRTDIEDVVYVKYNLQEVKKEHPSLYKQYIIEIYKLIFT